MFRRTGRTIAAVLALGFGGGTLLLGLGSTVADAPNLHATLAAGRGYLLATLPFFLAAAVLYVCKRELWFLPEVRAFRMLTFRPWRLKGPQVEQAPLEEYRALATESDHNVTVVSLVTESGESIPVREFSASSEARAFAQRFAEVTGLPLQSREAV